MYIVCNEDISDEQMESELSAHFAELNNRLSNFNRSGRVNKFTKYEDDNTYIERRSVNEFIRYDIRYFNQNVSEYGNGFETDWDEDAVMCILYKDGHIRRISVDDDDGTKKISTDNIDSIIYSSGWGYAYAGPHVEIYNMREVVDYGKWGYKDLRQRYNDFDDIRLDFSI